MATTTTTDLSVYADRLRRAQAELRRQGADHLIVGASADLFYLTGSTAHVSERLNVLILPANGTPTAVVPALEAPQLATKRELLDIHAWEDTQTPTVIAARLIGNANGKTIAIGDQLHSIFLLRLQDAVPGARWIAGGPILRPLRIIKDTREIELLHEAGRRTDDAWHEFISEGKLSGLTEVEAMDRLATLTRKRGLGVGFGICASGPNAASPHHSTGSRVIQRGDAVIFDWGGTLEGYYSDVTRTVHIGEPSDEFRRVYDVVLRANQATLDAVRPGVPCEQIDATARTLISDAGYGAAFIHRVGHGLGLDVHEEPYLVGGNSLPLAVGMVFSDEPGIYLEGRFGVRIEDAVVCTETGGQRLNEATRELVVLE